jgi:squalene-associated FAD-dependent desaturase
VVDVDPRVKARVAVVGGGYAGLACAVELAHHGVPVEVFEAARVLGGRARRVVGDALTPDNGQHILVGAYTQTLALMRRVGMTEHEAFERTPLALELHPGFSLKAPCHGRIGLALAFARARGLSIAERLAAVRLMAGLQRADFRIDPDGPLAPWLVAKGQSQNLRSSLWEPLCIAALNTRPEEASAQVFANVLRDTFRGAPDASDLLLPRVDLSELFPDPAATWIEANGGRVHVGTNVRSVRAVAGGIALDDAGSTHPCVVLATPPWITARLLGPVSEAQATVAAIATFDYQPIFTTWLQYAPGTRLAAPMLGLRDGLVQWVFDRGQLGGTDGLVAAVISARGRHEEISLEMLDARVAETLAAAGLVRTEPLRTRTIAERRATFTCRPGLARPPNATGHPALLVAGDYTASDYPGTIEAAVRSGIAAARLAMKAPGVR